jgi:hypothetical protein
VNIEMIEQEPGTALTVQQRAALALGSSQTRVDLTAMVEKSLNITAIKNPAGRAECHAAAMALADARIAITKTGKAARDDATKFSKAVIAEEESLISITSPEEKRLLALRDAWDTKVAAEKAERERLERQRITAIHERIAEIRGYGVLALECRTADRVKSLIDRLANTEMVGFEEFDEEAKAVRTASMERMEQILDLKATEEAERERVRAEQAAEAARLKAEREELAAQRKAQAEEQERIEKAQAALAAQQAVIAEPVVPVEPAAPVDKPVPDHQEAVETQPPQDDAPTQGPTDEEVLWVASRAVADEFNMTQKQAGERIAAIFLPDVPF